MRRSSSICVAAAFAAALLSPSGRSAADGPFLDAALMDALAVPPLSETSDAAKERGYFGVNIEAMKDLGPAWGGDDGETGIKLTMVTPGAAADKGGLAEGDIVVAIDGAGFGSDPAAAQDLFLKIAVALGAGQEVEVAYVRAGERKTAKVTLIGPSRIDAPLADYPDYDWSTAKSPLEAELRALGAWAALDGVRAQMGRAARSTYNPRQLLADNPAPFRLKQVNSALTRPLQLGRQGVAIDTRLRNAQSPSEVLREQLALLDRQVRPVEGDRRDEEDPSLEWIMEELFLTLVATASDAAAAAKDLDIKQRDALDFAIRGFVGDRDGDYTEEIVADGLIAATKIDVVAYWHAFARLEYAAAVCAIRSWETLEALPAKPSTIDGITGDIIASRNTDYGWIVIGGPGSNRYSIDCAIVIDVGGDDVYANNAGGTREGMPAALVVDRAGDDTYRTTDAFSQGSGHFGAGLLIDVAGNDVYTGSSWAQGAAMCGAGALWDLAGDDLYHASYLSQGAASIGVAALQDDAGDDRYDSYTYSQAFGFVLGMGAIVERGGDDAYRARGKITDGRDPERSYLSMSQGFGYGMRPWSLPVGASGGIGVLSDAAGNDTYMSDYFSQGSSYWYSLGLLVDSAGHDQYVAGRYSQGGPTHLTAGALIDKAGNDTYEAYFGVSQGCGHDLAIGLLDDWAGNDTYHAGWLSQGAGNDTGIGILCDRGGNDRYDGASQVQGHGNRLDSRGADSFGLLLDAGGEDRYSAAESGNGVSKTRTKTGVLIDRIAK